jgi:lysophospholipase L1-like esterase
MQNYIVKFLIVISCTFIGQGNNLFAQGEDRWQAEVKEITKKYDSINWEKEAIVFTGSSSIRLWKTIQNDFPKSTIINTGFGGSQTHDLLKYLDALIIRFAPAKVFIYEGDNDINAQKPIPQIIQEHLEIITRLKEKLPDATFYILSTKPSPSRWALKDSYLELNEQMKNFCTFQSGVTFIDVWTPMMDKSGKPNAKLFVEDKLHMNKKGYKIWKKAIKPHVN